MSYSIWSLAVEPTTLYLVGEGEHTGTVCHVDGGSYLGPATQLAVAAYLDRLFLRAHHERLRLELAAMEMGTSTQNAWALLMAVDSLAKFCAS